jgi:hypothetical protein
VRTISGTAAVLHTCGKEAEITSLLVVATQPADLIEREREREREREKGKNNLARKNYSQ